MSALQPERIQSLNETSPQSKGAYVLYWMQQSQRAEHNPALTYAVEAANDVGVPVRVVFGLMDDDPEATLRHYTFMLEGLRETQQTLATRGIRMDVYHGAPDAVALRHATDAVMLVTDRGYLRHQRAWRRRVAEDAPCRVVQVEGDVVVPVEVVTDKPEYAARTIRPKIHEHLDRFLRLPDAVAVAHDAAALDVAPGLPLDDIAAVTDRLALDTSVPAVSSLFQGGTSVAEALLDDFLATKLAGYDDNRNQVQTNAVSHMSKYLHFGQISPVWLALQIQGAEGPSSDIDSYIEEMIVRRELAVNHVAFRPDTYDDWACLPEWARDTLQEHADDEREHLYALDALEQGETHDPYWNAAMKEMRETGYMHNYMRMYWGKKILEWTPDPKTALRWTLHLNNTYFLDGRDPNSYANVLWIFGLHDRGWKERPVFGKTRYMNQNGLKRKANPDAYVEKVDRLAQEARATE